MATGIPLQVSFGDNGLRPTTFQACSHVFLDMLEGVMFDGSGFYSYFGVSVECVFVPFSIGTAVYYKNDQHLVPRYANITAALSRHFVDDFGGYYGGWCDIDSPFLGFEASDKRTVTQATWDYLNAPVSAVTAQHHTHVTAIEAVASLTRRPEEVKRMLALLPTDSSNAMVAGTALWLDSLDEDLFQRVTATQLFTCASVKEFATVGKKISIRMKSYQNLIGVDLRSMFELDVLTNRGVGLVDWQGEHDHRVNPSVATLSQSDVYDAAVRIFSRVEPERVKPRRLSWEEFWQSRWQWSASGSIHSQYDVEDIDGRPKEHEYKNKFINLCCTGDRALDYYLNRRPEIQAWASYKYEWAKMRAIYGTDLTSYLMAHFAFYNCEDILPTEFPVGRNARPSYVAAQVGSTLNGVTPMCVDFEDFNSQHSISSMQAVIQAYFDVYRNDLSEEQQKAVMWTKASVARMLVHDNMGLKKDYLAKGTLLSGWRLTTLMNSVLNKIYTDKITEGGPGLRRAVHNGDDVLLGVSNFAMTGHIVRRAAEYNIRLQRTKCGYAGIAEFLRVDHRRGEHGQYLTRNVATLVHSRIESVQAVSVVNLVDAMETRLAEFVTRGGDYATAVAIRDAYDRKLALKYDMPVGDVSELRETHRVCGGISEAKDADVSTEYVTTRAAKEVTLPAKMPGVADYAKVLIRQLQLKLTVERVYKKVYDATLRAVMMVHYNTKRRAVEDRYPRQVWRAIHRSYKEVSKSAQFGKAAMIGMTMDVLATDDNLQRLAMRVSGSIDPLWVISIIT